jgi:hypothetical protein
MTARGQQGYAVSICGYELLETGTKTVAAAATPETLVADSTICCLVWVGARWNRATGVSLNTAPVGVGLAGASAQVMPIMPSNFEGIFIPLLDAQSLIVDVAVNGEGVEYAIFG